MVAILLKESYLEVLPREKLCGGQSPRKKHELHPPGL
jgi:hypothetical protein